MILLLILLGFDYPKQPSPCVIDVCEEKVCTVETPEGTVDVDKKDGYREGMKIECPIWLVEQT